MSETLEKLEAWFQERPIWMQEAAKRIAKNNAISQNDLQDFITLCKEEADIDDDVCEVNGDPIFEICSEIDESEGSLWLESISDVKGINRLNPKNPLKFGDKESPLTIIYGLNGSGKSGYVRALKHASGVKSLGNYMRMYSIVVIKSKVVLLQLRWTVNIKNSHGLNRKGLYHILEH